MDEKLRAVRRRRRRERRIMRRIWNLLPLAVVLLAWLLSAGVVKLMETSKPAPLAHSAAAPSPAVHRAHELHSLVRTEVRPDLPLTLSASILDDALVAGPPDDARPRDPDPGGAPPAYSTDSSSTSKVSTAPGGIAPGTPPSP